MMKKIISILLVAAMLTLSGCSSAPQPTMEELMAEVNAEHQTVERFEGDLSPYLREPTESIEFERLTLFPEAKAEYQPEKLLTFEQAKEDIDFVFHVFHDTYGLYDYFGGDEAFSYILNELKPGVTELQIAAKLEYFMRSHGAEGTSFDTIVASGYHSAMPHAVPTEKPLENGDFVTMDFGCRYQGYCSDMTRTVVIGKADPRQKEIYQIVLEAQQAALEGLRPGMTGTEGDRLARDVIEKAGYGEYFGHGLGHSVGLEIHEKPALSTRDETVLLPGMIETVEPGIYIPGFGGVRIEDMVVLTETGIRNLTTSPKELIEL